MATIGFFFLLLYYDFRIGTLAVSRWLSAHFLVSAHLVFFVIEHVLVDEVLASVVFGVNCRLGVKPGVLP